MEGRLILVVCFIVLKAQVWAGRPHQASSPAPQEQKEESVEAILHSIFFAQLETKAMLEELSHSVVAQLLDQANTLQESEGRKNVTHHLLQELEHLEDKVSQQKREVDRSRDDLRQKEEELQRLQSSFRDLQNENELLKIDARLKEEEFLEMKTEIRFMGMENDRLKTDKLLLDGEIRQLKSEVRLAEGESQQQKTDFRLLENEKQKLEIDLRLMEARNQQLMSDVREAEDEKQEAEGELRRVQEGNRVAEETSSGVAQVREESPECVAEVRRLILELHEAKAINRHVEEAARELQNDKTGFQEPHEEESHRSEEQRLDLQHQVEKLKEAEERCQNNLTQTVQRYLAKDCAELFKLGVTESGVYLIFPSGSRVGVRVWCDMVTEGGGWTVFLARRPHNPQQNFSTTWCNYRDGFGDPSVEYWLGNEHLHALTGTAAHSLRVEAVNLEGQRRSARWSHFSVGDEASRYMLQIGGYASSSSLGDGLVKHYSLNGKKFSTIDQDHDTWPRASCSDTHGGAGWWFGYCGRVNPTGPMGRSDADPAAAHWHYFSPRESRRQGLAQLYMMVRPNHDAWRRRRRQRQATRQQPPASRKWSGAAHS